VLTARDPLPAETEAFYRRALDTLARAGVPFLLGGAFALEHYTGITRNTHDIDAFVREEDARPALDALASAGYETELLYPHWLGKARAGADELDVIYSSGSGVARVDDLWFANAVDGEALGRAVKLIPAEEMIWSKSFVQERERFDGADIMHLLRARAERIDWGRLLARFGPYWRVLLAHLVTFGFVYPDERRKVPDRVMHALLRRLEPELASDAGVGRVCQGTLLSREQYLVDVLEWGYEDARRLEPGAMRDEDIRVWTEAIADK
jgi:hypothetical protein